MAAAKQPRNQTFTPATETLLATMPAPLELNADGTAGIILQTVRGKGREQLETRLSVRDRAIEKSEN
jgi:hypothetical protein